MKYQSIADIYDANERVRTSVKETLASLDESRCNARPDDEKWSVAEVAEHLSIVGSGMYRICSKLLSKAETAGQAGNGQVDLKAFGARLGDIAEVKLEAPEMVRPTGNRSVAESLASLDETEKAFGHLKELFEKYDANTAKFPHPYLGDMTAVEWLVMYGLHEGRHLRQIQRIVGKIG